MVFFKKSRKIIASVRWSTRCIMYMILKCCVIQNMFVKVFGFQFWEVWTFKNIVILLTYYIVIVHSTFFLHILFLPVIIVNLWFESLYLHSTLCLGSNSNSTVWSSAWSWIICIYYIGIIFFYLFTPFLFVHNQLICTRFWLNQILPNHNQSSV